MKKTITTPRSDATAMVEAAWQTVGDSFERFCLTAGIATLASMMEDDTERLCGPRHRRSEQRGGHRWARTIGRLDFHGGTIPVERPRVRGHGGEIPLPSWEAARSEDWLGRWAMNNRKVHGSTHRVRCERRIARIEIASQREAKTVILQSNRRPVQKRDLASNDQSLSGVGDHLGLSPTRLRRGTTGTPAFLRRAIARRERPPCAVGIDPKSCSEFRADEVPLLTIHFLA